MKFIVAICRILVGGLFIFSGLVKLNDPVGFSYKLDEYFSEAVLGLEFLQPIALPLAITLVIVEVLLGIMLWLGFLKKLTLSLLSLMIVFFTFLTFYSAYYNKVTDCGCFGDAIPLTPWESFYKDLILLVMIILLVVGSRYIKPILAKATMGITTFLSAIVCFGIAYYVLNHLPILDFRAYKVGTDIAEASAADPSLKAEIKYDWYFMVDGEEKVVTTDGDFPEGYGEQVKVETREISEAKLPPIHDFSMVDQNGEDVTSEILNTPKVLVLISYDLEKSKAEGWKSMEALVNKAQGKYDRVILLTAGNYDHASKILSENSLKADIFQTDQTALKTIVRSNPGVITLRDGVISGKAHYNDAEDLIP